MIEIKFIGETPMEALANLVATSWMCSQDKSVAAAADRIYSGAQPAAAPTATGSPALEMIKAAVAEALNSPPKTEKTAPQDPYSETTPYPESEASPYPEPEPKPEPKPEAGASKVPSLEEIRAAGIDAARKYGNAAVKEILSALDADNMTSLPEEARGTFLDRLKELDTRGKAGDANA